MKKTALLMTTLGVLAGLLSSCANQSSLSHKPILSSQTTHYLSLASEPNTNHHNAYDDDLLALQNMIANHNLNAAKQLIRSLKAAPLSGDQQQFLAIQEAYFTLQSGQPYQALLKLGKIKRPDSLSSTAQQNYYAIKSQAYARNNQIAQSLVLQLQHAQNLSPNQELSLWYALQNLPLKTLNQLATQYTAQSVVSGWLRLAIIAQEYSNTNVRLANAIIAWQQNFPNHPANAFIPDQATLANIQNTQTPQQIAVLLPSQGNLKAISQAIRDGIMSAYLQQNDKKRIALRFYDTSTQSASDAYQLAVNNGAQIVIGPLLKSNVSRIASDTSVPTIALNYTDDNETNLMQFGLSPTQEAEQAAEEAWLFGVDRALTITPNSDWGQKVLGAFSQTWSNNNASITGQLAFQPDNLKQQIAALLGVEQSEQRADTVKKAVKFARNQYTDFIPRRRQDTDGIFLAATASQAKTIMPLLRFYFAGTLPVFALSSIYRPDASADYNRDLDNVYFCDMPLMLSPQPIMINRRHRIQQLWPTQYRHYARFYAIGIDSYLLAEHITHLVNLPYFGLQGVSGRLYLQPKNRIYRQLNWAQIKNGEPKAL